MKKCILYFFAITLTILSFSCENVVDIPLENQKPKLVIDAAIKWQKGSTGANQTIKLSLTNDFYSDAIVFANGAQVTLTNSSNTVFNFVETPNTGNYVCTNFVPVINEDYTLKVVYQGETYTATSKLLACPPIANVQQEVLPGINGQDQYQIKFFFQDNGSEDNFYLVGAKNPNLKIYEYGAISDEFFQGNMMFGFYTNDKINRNDIIPLTVQCMNSSYFNYMSKLIAISGANTGNPFATPPATLRGNIINQSNTENFPLGYFSLSESDTVNYQVQ